MITPIAFDGCFGWFHEAAGPAPAGDRGVVLCASLGYEEICTHRALRDMAMRLADAGFAVLRFDYPGTGDSLGSDEDPGRLEALLGSIRAAVRTLRATAGLRHVALAGLRMGALLAAGAGADADELVLMAPPSSAAGWLREQLALARLAGEAEAGPALRACGFTTTAETASALRGFRPLVAPANLSRRILVLDDPDRFPESPASAALRARGAEVTTEPFEGLPALLQDARLSETPFAAIETVARWLTPAAGDAGWPRMVPKAVLSAPGFTEQPAAIAGTALLSGVLCLPDAPLPGAPATVLLNTGANRRIGYGRLAVDVARRLAQAGYASLRLDVAGVGDSDARPGGGRVVYTDAAVGDVQAAIDALALAGWSRVVLAGVCSGAHLAFHTALADTRVAGMVMMNLQRLYWREGDSLELAPRRARIRATDFYLRGLLQPSTWRRLAAGDVDTAAVISGLFSRYRERLTALLDPLLRRRTAGRVRSAADFRTLAQRGVRALLAYGADDPGLDELKYHFGHGGRLLRRHAHTDLRIVPDADHNLSVPSARVAFAELLAGALHEIAVGRSANPRQRRSRADLRATTGLAQLARSRTNA
jgi:pimeloyl-ACP methyl ester carboxylesterase